VTNAQTLSTSPPASPLLSALQWLLDDLHDADETHSDGGVIYDSVEHAAAALVEAGGSLNWYSLDDAKAYRRREAKQDAAEA
jgi:hypothetical protein